MFLPRSFATLKRSAERLQIRVRSLESLFVSALCASGFSQLKCPQKSLVRSTSHPLFFFSVVQQSILPLKRFRFPVVGLVEGVWQALCLLATSWRKRPCWGTRRSPNPPDKPSQNVAVLSQKRDWKCVHSGLLFWQDQAVCFVVGVEKLALYALDFPGV